MATKRTAPQRRIVWPSGSTVAELAAVGVRRVPTGGALLWAALGGFAEAGRELLERGTYGLFEAVLHASDRRALD